MGDFVDFSTYRLVPKKNNPSINGKVVYGPIISKRSFHSLGVNLWPLGKVCPFDCVFCHCGKKLRSGDSVMPLEELKQKIEKGFKFNSENNQFVQDLLIEGNGEPTFYPQFPEVVDFVLEKRDNYFPSLPLVLFTNCSNLEKAADSILKFDQVFFKLDCSDKDSMKRLNNYDSFDEIVENLIKIKELINTNKYKLKNFELSTAVVGSGKGNLKELYAKEFSDLIKKLSPQKLYLYDIDRIVPGSKDNFKVPFEEIKKLGEHIFKNTGIEVVVLYSSIGRGLHELSKLNL